MLASLVACLSLNPYLRSLRNHPPEMTSGPALSPAEQEELLAGWEARLDEILAMEREFDGPGSGPAASSWRSLRAEVGGRWLDVPEPAPRRRFIDLEFELTNGSRCKWGYRDFLFYQRRAIFHLWMMKEHLEHAATCETVRLCEAELMEIRRVLVDLDEDFVGVAEDIVAQERQIRRDAAHRRGVRALRVRCLWMALPVGPGEGAHAWLLDIVEGLLDSRS